MRVSILLLLLIIIIITWTKGGEFARAVLKNVCTEDVFTLFLLHVLPPEQSAKVGAGGGGFHVPLETVASLR